MASGKSSFSSSHGSRGCWSAFTTCHPPSWGPPWTIGATQTRCHSSPQHGAWNREKIMPSLSKFNHVVHSCIIPGVIFRPPKLREKPEIEENVYWQTREWSAPVLEIPRNCIISVSHSENAVFQDFKFPFTFGIITLRRRRYNRKQAFEWKILIFIGHHCSGQKFVHTYLWQRKIQMGVFLILDIFHFTFYAHTFNSGLSFEGNHGNS